VDFAANKRAQTHRSASLHARGPESEHEGGIAPRGHEILDINKVIEAFSRGTNWTCVPGAAPFVARARIISGKLGRVHEIGRYREIDHRPRRSVLVKNAQRALLFPALLATRARPSKRGSFRLRATARRISDPRPRIFHADGHKERDLRHPSPPPPTHPPPPSLGGNGFGRS